jgi:hypothetical protein
MIRKTQLLPVAVSNPQPKTRAERAFHLVERALPRTLLPRGASSSTFYNCP